MPSSDNAHPTIRATDHWSDRGRLRSRDALLLVLLCLCAYLPGIAVIPPIDRDEARYVQATKQMAVTGDYVDIRFQDSSRYKKPVGIYWLQSAAVSLSGKGAEAPIWVYRSVSVLAATVAVLAMAWLAAALFGASVGPIAGAVLAAFMLLATEGRIAKTDATLLATVLVAQAALARIYVDLHGGKAISRAAPWIFWAAFGAGVLIKGPVIAAICGATVGVLIVLDRWRLKAPAGERWFSPKRDLRLLWALKPLPGLLLVLAIAAPWLALITIKSGGAFWQESVGKDFLSKVGAGQESHGFPPGYYSILMPLLTWPFGAVLLRAGLSALGRIGADARLRFMAAWFLPWWLLVEIMPTKLPHYILPAYPALVAALTWSLAAPAEIDAALTGWKLWLYRLGLFGAGVVTLGLAGLAALAVPLAVGTLSWSGLLAAILILAAGWLGAGMAGVTRRNLAMAAMAAVAAFGLFFQFTAPQLQPIWLSPRIAAAFEALKPCPDARLVSASYHEPSLVFLTATDTVLTNAPGAAAALLSAPACTVVVVDQAQRAAFLGALGDAQSRFEEAGTIDGVNYSNGRKLALTFYKAR